MKLIDANVLINASRHDAVDHAKYRAWMDELLALEEPFALTDLVVCGVLRILTNPKIYKVPHTPGQALDIVDDLRERNECVWLPPGPRHWPIFRQMVYRQNIRGNLINDAWLAALALEHDCELISADSDFGKFPGLRWRHPLAGM
jgi:uncharacterized protein